VTEHEIIQMLQKKMQVVKCLKSVVIDYEMLTPPDLEKQFSLTGGHITHGALGLDQLYFMRPEPEYCNYYTPIRHLYLCGSSAHPGGGVMGAAGKNAAKRIIDDIAHNRITF